MRPARGSASVTSTPLARHACGRGGWRRCCTKPSFDSSVTGGAPGIGRIQRPQTHSSPLKGASGTPCTGLSNPLLPSFPLPSNLGIQDLSLFLLISLSLPPSPTPIQKFDDIFLLLLSSPHLYSFLFYFLFPLLLTIEQQGCLLRPPLFTNGNLNPRALSDLPTVTQ